MRFIPANLLCLLGILTGVFSLLAQPQLVVLRAQPGNAYETVQGVPELTRVL